MQQVPVSPFQFILPGKWFLADILRKEHHHLICLKWFGKETESTVTQYKNIQNIPVLPKTVLLSYKVRREDYRERVKAKSGIYYCQPLTFMLLKLMDQVKRAADDAWDRLQANGSHLDTQDTEKSGRLCKSSKKKKPQFLPFSRQSAPIHKPWAPG